jgi:hypothetical protein
MCRPTTFVTVSLNTLYDRIFFPQGMKQQNYNYIIHSFINQIIVFKQTLSLLKAAFELMHLIS